MESITNKVAESGILTIDPANFYMEGERELLDLKPLLIEEFLLKEKDFREYVKSNNWENYTNKFVAITCSNDAIIPVWAYMLLASALQPFAKKIIFGSLNDLETALFLEQLATLNVEEYRDQRIVIKGCGDLSIPVSAYMELTRKLKPVVKSIMYGEPCSTVPVYKKK